MLILSVIGLLPLCGAWIIPPYYEGPANDGTEYSCSNFTYEGWLAIQNTPWDFNQLNLSRDISDADSHEKRDLMEAVEVPDFMIPHDPKEEIIDAIIDLGPLYFTDLDNDPDYREVEDDVENDPDFIVNRRRRAIVDAIRQDVQEEENDFIGEENDNIGAEELEEPEDKPTYEANVQGCLKRDEQSFLLKLELEQEGRKSNRDLLYPGQMTQVRLKNLHNKAPITFFISVSAFDEGNEAGAFGELPRLREVENRRGGCRSDPNNSEGHGHHHSHGHAHHHHSHGHGHHHHSHGLGHHNHSHGHDQSHDHGLHHPEDHGKNHTHDGDSSHTHHHTPNDDSPHAHHHSHDHDTHHHNHDHAVRNETESLDNEKVNDGVESVVVEGINTDGTGLIDLRIELVDTLNPVKEEEIVERVPDEVPQQQRETKPVKGEVASCPHVVQGWMEDDSAVEIDYMPPESGCIVIRAYASYPLENDGSLIFTSEAYEEYLQIFDCVQPNPIPKEDHDSEDYELDSEVESEQSIEDSSIDDESDSSEEGHRYNLRPRNKRFARYIADQLDADVSESSDDDSDSSDSDSESSEDGSESSEEGLQSSLSVRTKRAANSLTENFDDSTYFIERQLERLRRASETKQERKQKRRERKENKKNRKNRRKERKNRRRNNANGNSTSDATSTGNIRNREILKNLTDRGERFCCKEGILHKKASTYVTEEGTLPVLACDSVPMEVTVWGSHKHKIETSSCEVKYKSCCNAFDLDMWKKWLEEKKERRQRRRRRKNKNRRNRGNRNDVN